MAKRIVVNGAVIEGAVAVPVDISIEMRPGMPSIAIEGARQNAAIETRGLVRTALRSQGFMVPRESISVEVAPSTNFEREFVGPLHTTESLALPIALGILAVSGQMDASKTEGRLFFGGLDIGGNVTQCRGSIAVSRLCETLGLQGVVSAAVPPEWRPSDAKLLSMDSISSKDLDFTTILPGSIGTSEEPHQIEPVYPPSVVAEVAEALATGLPLIIETDKPARAAEAMRPFFTVYESEDASLMRDLAGARGKGSVVTVGDAPSRSVASLIGGGRPIRPGAISTATGGALVLGDIDRMSAPALQSIMHTTGEGRVNIVRVDGKVSFPSETALVMTARSDRMPYALKALEYAPCDSRNAIVVGVEDLESGLDELQAQPGTLVEYRESVRQRIEAGSLYIDANSKGGITVNFAVDGERRRVELVKQAYEDNGSLCIQAYDVTPGSDEFGTLWSDVSTNIGSAFQDERTVCMKRTPSDPLPGVLLDSGVFGAALDDARAGGYEVVRLDENALLSMRDMAEFREMVMPQDCKDIALGVGCNFAVVPAFEADGINLNPEGEVNVEGHDYTLYKAVTFEESRLVDDILDRHQEMSVSEHRVCRVPSTKKFIDALRLKTKSSFNAGDVEMERDVQVPKGVKL